MKKVLVLLAALLLGATQAHSAPFIVCDPYPLETSLLDTDPPNPEYFILVMDTGAAQTVQPFVLPDGRIQLKYDIATLAKGKHVVKVKAAHSIWGESAEVSYSFRSGTPKALVGVVVSK